MERPLEIVIPNLPEVFVLWHPDCPIGETLARRVYCWLRPGNGLGPQVFYRSLPAPNSEAGGLPLALPCEPKSDDGVPRGGPGAKRQIVLVLIDSNMIADAGWRHWIATLHRPSSELLLVALDATAYNVPGRLRELNFLRPLGLPLPSSDPPGPAAAVEGVVRSLLKQLTEALCGLMLGRQPPRVTSQTSGSVDHGASKITIFLSHAKADGTPPARRIRDFIHSNTQLAAFYDENDIPFGSGFKRILESNIANKRTVGLIAVRSAEYAMRPWCRRELSLFRRPHRDDVPERSSEHWMLSPVLVADALEGGARTASIPELGNAPLIRWSEDVPNQEEQIVTTVLRDALLASFHSMAGWGVPDGPSHIVLNWVPDPTTLLLIPRVREARDELRVYYPGRGLTALELDTLHESFPQLTFNSFGQFE